MSTIIDLQGVTVSRNEHELLRDVTLSLKAGDFAYLTGPVGSGKSSLLEILYGELVPKGGVAKVLDYNLHRMSVRQRQALRRSLGIVFQSQAQLLYNYTVQGNLDFVLRAVGVKKREQRATRIEEALAQVSMEGKHYKYPHELSGGEAERICIARALVVRPRLILLDEPTTGLDSETSLLIGQLIQSLAREGVAVLMSTHNETLIQELPATRYHIDLESRTLERIDLPPTLEEVEETSSEPSTDPIEAAL